MVPVSSQQASYNNHSTPHSIIEWLPLSCDLEFFYWSDSWRVPPSVLVLHINLTYRCLFCSLYHVHTSLQPRKSNKLLHLNISLIYTTQDVLNLILCCCRRGWPITLSNIQPPNASTFTSSLRPLVCDLYIPQKIIYECKWDFITHYTWIIKSPRVWKQWNNYIALYKASITNPSTIKHLKLHHPSKL